MNNRKNKSLHNITIEKINFNTLLRYNPNTNYIEIKTRFNYQDPNKTKKYRESNKDKISEYSKQYRKDNKNKLKDEQKAYRESNHDSNTPRWGSLELSIKRSCINQGINRENWDGFLTDQKYCHLWTEKFREIIRYRFHNKCYLCNKSKEDNQNRKLSVHHVNYNKNCLCQKTCEFVPLCSRCHGKTNYRRSYYEDLIMCYLFPDRYFMVEI